MRSDLAIESDVLRQLALTPELTGLQVSASTDQGVVTLTGNAPDKATREAAQAAVSKVSGVRSVEDEIEIGGAGSRAAENRAAESRVAEDRAAEDQSEQNQTEPIQTEPNQAETTQTEPAQAASNPATANQTASSQQGAPYPPGSEPSPGAQGNWGQAGPPPDAQNGQIPPVPSGQMGAQEQDPQSPAEEYPQPPNGQKPSQPPQSSPSNEQYPPQPSGQYSPQSSGQYPQPSTGGYPRSGGQYPPPGGQYPQSSGQYPQQPIRQYPPAAGGNSPEPDGGYPRSAGQMPDSRSPYNSRAPYNDGPVGYAQTAPSAPAAPVTMPAGVLLRVRISEPLDSRRLQPGDVFHATAAQDIFEGNVLALPRGATLTGRVVDVKRAGAFRGSAGFALQLTSIDLSGRQYPIATDTFATDTRGKGEYTAANTAGGAVLGALVGAVAGGGPGAAIGAVAGGAVGAGASAATLSPREVMPPETMLSFHLQAPVMLAPVSYQEAQRLAASSMPPRPRVRPRPYPYYGYPPPPPPYYYPYRYWR